MDISACAKFSLSCLKLNKYSIFFFAVIFFKTTFLNSRPFLRHTGLTGRGRAFLSCCAKPECQHSRLQRVSMFPVFDEVRSLLFEVSQDLYRFSLYNERGILNKLRKKLGAGLSLQLLADGLGKNFQ